MTLRIMRTNLEALLKSPRANDANKMEKIVTLVLVMFLIGDLCLSTAIVKYVSYTEIDWVAYMQQVDTFMNGERNYIDIEGNTGPLVYPALFLYIFSIFYMLTNSGAHIETAQILFIVVYIGVTGLTMSIYRQADRIPLVAIFLLCLSRRIHSIFLLRLFNDGVCMFFLYTSIRCFISYQFYLGCFIYSLAVGTKMNILLFSPGLLLLLIQSRGIWGTIKCLSVCAITQLIIGFPFLIRHPISYLKRAFEFSRVFKYEYTVNLKFLSEEVFLSKLLSLGLLLGMIFVLVGFGVKIFRECKLEKCRYGMENRLSTDYILYVLFVSNFIGVVFCRSMHYQFYTWYFHSLPFLLWYTEIPTFFKLALFGVIELCYNIYPATSASSLLLQQAHIILLFFLWKSPVPSSIVKDRIDFDIKKNC